MNHQSLHKPGFVQETGLPILEPLLDPVIRTLATEQQSKLHDWVGSYGSPLNMVFPHTIGINHARLAGVLDAHAVKSKIFYAAKVNKSHSLVAEAVQCGLGVDVSSRFELRDALDAGCAGGDICASGPAKGDTFHHELIAVNALISIDSAEELEDLLALLTDELSGTKARILLRFRPASNKHSRFGIPHEQLHACLQVVAQNTDRLAFEGFHFHLGGYRADNRVEALIELSDWIMVAREYGLRVEMLDIGGGLPIRYLDAGTYADFIDVQTSSHYRNGKVPGSYYPYGGPNEADDWLDQFLSATGPSSKSVAQYLKDEGITLALEPGRSLVDQSAITVFRIARTKRQPDGSFVLFVEGSSFSACETWFASEFLIDPILVPAASSTREQDGSVRAYIAGHSCLEEDVITNRLLPFPFQPLAGDLLVYANTAGYQMDLLENEFHRVPMPRRVSISADLATVQPDDHKGASR